MEKLFPHNVIVNQCPNISCDDSHSFIAAKRTAPQVVALLRLVFPSDSLCHDSSCIIRNDCLLYSSRSEKPTHVVMLQKNVILFS